MGHDGGSAETGELRERVTALERALADVNGELRELHDREALYRRLVELAPDAMLVHGMDRRIVYINPAGARMFGAAAADDMLGMIATDLIHPDSRHAAEHDIDRLLAGALPSSVVPEKHLVRIDSGDFFGDVSATAIEWDDAPAVLVVVRDATKRRTGRAKYETAEAGRREAHLRLLEAIDAMSEGFALFDSQDRLQICNRRYATDIGGVGTVRLRPGISFDEMVAKLAESDLWHDKEPEARDALFAAMHERHRNLPSEAVIQCPSGRWVRQTKKRTRQGGVVAVYGDITDLMEHEQALRDSEERYRQLLEALPDAVVISDERAIVFVNAAALRLFGAGSAEDLIGKGIYTLVPPHLIAVQRERRRQVLTECRTLPPFDTQRIRLDGTIVDVESIATFMTWEGRPAFLGVLRDITMRKAAEAALAETERRFRAATDNIPGAVYQRVLTPEGRLSFSYVSAGIKEVTGLTPEQIERDAGRFLSLMRDFRDEFGARVEESARTMEPFDLEIPIVGTDGRPRWIQSKGRPRKRADGATVWDGILMDVTEQKLAQESARRSHRWLVEAIGSMPSGFMLWDSQNRLVLWNERMASYHPDPGLFREGLSYEALIAAPCRDIRQRMGDAVADQWLAERRRQHCEASGFHEFQGSAGRWFTYTARRTSEGFTVTLLTDVTERHDAEQRLRASEERYKALVNLSPDAVYVHRGGRIIVCNEAAVALFGAPSAKNLIGRHSLDLVHPEYRDQIRRRQQTSAKAGTRTASGRQKRLRCDGSWFWAEVSAGAIDWEGERSGIVIVRDATEQIAAEEALVRSKEEAELANRSKTEFLANISHELRTPLNAIIGFSDLMQREMLGPLGNDRYLGYLRDIHQSGNHLHDVINDILDLSKIEAGQLELREEPVNVRAAIDRCMRLVAARAEQGGLTLIPRVADDLPTIFADERKVKQILINLLSNAVKFTEYGGTVTVEAFAARGGIVLRVSDTGIGMDAAEIPRALTPFMQVDSTLSRRHEGTGLGLPLTKSLAELHGGSLELESAPGEGTTVTIFLPFSRSSAPTAAA